MTPPRPILRLGWAFHKVLHRVTGGRVSTTAPSADGRVGTLFLLSSGRKTGKVRRNGLFYIEDGPNFVVVASNAGENVDPSWWLNLQATPDADGRDRDAVDPGPGAGRDRRGGRAPVAAPRRRLRRVRGVSRRGPSRTIPVVILEPR